MKSRGKTSKKQKSKFIGSKGHLKPDLRPKKDYRPPNQIE
jgi:hypothetical protein